MTKTRTTRSSTDPPIPAWAIPKLEELLERSVEGWEAKEPRWRSPSPEHSVDGAWFDVAAVVKVVKALRQMPHTKEQWFGTRFEPETWQVIWLIAPVFGWKGPDGFRIIREVWDEIPRKNGKSTIASRLALVLASADRARGGEVYAAATSILQAGVVFNEAKVVVQHSRALRKRCQPLTSIMRFGKTGTLFRVLSRVADAAHGLNVSGAVVDEVHLHKSADLIDAIETGTAARQQPLIFYITTAGDEDETTVYAEKHNYAVRLAEGKLVDASVWAVIWAADRTDDPFLEATWAKANPNYPISPMKPYLEQKFRKARENPSLLQRYMRLHLNIRLGLEALLWPAAPSWSKGAGLVVEEKLKGREAWGGLCAASAVDLSAIAWTFDNPEGSGTWTLWRHFLPEAYLPELDRRTNGAASTWRKSGKLIVTEGNEIDIAAITEQIRADCLRFDVREIGYDARGAIGVVQPLMAEDVAGFHPVYDNTPGAAMVDWEAMVRKGSYNHGGDPVAAWQVSHLAVRETGGGAFKIDRKGSSDWVYGMSAAEISLRRYLLRSGDEPGELLIVR